MLSCAVLVVGLIYIVAEYCTQSHLATEDYASACQGIKWTRRFKKYTYWFRLLLNFWDRVYLLVWTVVHYPWQKATTIGRRQTATTTTASPKTLVWDWKVRTQPHHPQRRPSATTQPLMNEEEDPHDLQDEEGRSRVSMPTLQLPIQMHSRSPSPTGNPATPGPST